ncbi:putative ribonuclease H protein [Glycine soja]
MGSTQNGGITATKIQNLKKDLNALEAGVNGSNISQAEMELKKSLQEQLWTTAIAYESMMRQESRVKWIREGDTNSAYFHRLINHRRRVNAFQGGMNGLMRKAKEENMYKAYQVGSNKVEISLLQFVDDTMFWGEADMENVKTIKVVLRSFELASGLKINFAKSTFGAFGQTDLWKQQAATYLNCQLLQHQLIRSTRMYQDMGWEWNFAWRRALFDNEITSAANFLRDIAEIKIQQQVSDTWEWSADPEGQYSTRSAYDLIGEEATDSSQEECFEKLWRIKVPVRFLVFAWRLLRDRLPTRKNLQRRQIQLRDSLCPLYRTQQEDASHLFFHCSKVQPIWWETMSWLQVKGAFPLSPHQHFLHHLGVQPTGVRNNRWHCWWLALTWSIWKLRNSIVFSNANFDANKLFEEAIFLLWSWLRGFEKDFTVHFNHWSRQCGFCGVPATTIWVFRHCRGFCGFQQGQCGFSGSVGGSVASTDDNVGVEGAVSDRFQVGGEREAISGRRMTKRRGRARFSSARGL